jgi:RNA polymerase sigma-70 factor (ECF subfamily)
MNDAEESGLVQKAQRGDPRAFFALLRHYHRPVYRLAFALTRDVGAATSVTRAAVLKAKEGVRFMADGRFFFPWIAGIVGNRVRSRRRPDVPLVSTRGPQVAPGVFDLAERLLQAVDELEPDEQLALVLRIGEQLSYSAIETVLQATPGSARSLLARARAHLTAQMRAAGSDGATHLTPDQLSAQLDGALEGDSFDLIRHHLAGCEECRLQCMRMASADDVLRALLVHDPEDSFYEPLVAFLEDESNAKEAAGWIPPPLESAIATETARLEEQRWSCVSLAVPRPFVLPAAAVRPLDAPPKPAAMVASPPPALTPDAVIPLPAPAPSRPAAAISPRTGPPARRDLSTLLAGCALAAVLVLLAGHYLGRWSLSLRLGGFPAAATEPAASIAPQLPVWISKGEVPAPPIASDSSTSPAPAEKRPPATAPAKEPATTAVKPATAPAAGPATGTTERPVTPRRAADNLGLLCGRIRDESGLPVVRAQVLLADLQLGALTDRNGRFCLSAPIGARTVSVIALGFATQRRVVTIGARTPELAVTLRSAAVQESLRTGK